MATNIFFFFLFQQCFDRNHHLSNIHRPKCFELDQPSKVTQWIRYLNRDLVVARLISDRRSFITWIFHLPPLVHLRKIMSDMQRKYQYSVRKRGYLFFSVKDRNLSHRVDTIGNIFTSGAATR